MSGGHSWHPVKMRGGGGRVLYRDRPCTNEGVGGRVLYRDRPGLGSVQRTLGLCTGNSMWTDKHRDSDENGLYITITGNVSVARRVILLVTIPPLEFVMIH